MSKNNVLEKKDKNIIEIIISIILILMIIVLSSLIAVAFITPKDSGKLLFNIDDKVFATVEVGGKERFVMPNPEAKDGYSFGGWYFDKDTLSDPCTPETIKDKNIKGDTNVYGKWIKNEYTITYNLDGGTNAKANPSGYVVDTATIKVAAPTKLGYTFGGWYGKSDFGDTVITEIATGSIGNKELFAKWTKDTYTIAYNLDGGVNAKANPIGYAVDTATIKLAAPTKVGYTFGGWYSEDTFATKVTEIATGSTGNKTLFAKWSKDTYTIAYELNGGVEVTANPTTYAIDTATITLNAPTKLGYTFDGWCEKSDLTDTPITEIAIGSTENKTLFAKWTAIEYGITYNLDGGINGTNPTTYTFDTATITLNAPTKLGYTFGGWYSEDTFVTQVTEIAIGSTENKTLYAKWTAIVYDITYNLDGGTNSIDNPSGYTIATPTITLATPTKLGYRFLGWFSLETGGEEVKQIAIGGTGTVTVFARWMIFTYGITYELNGGTNHLSNPATYTIEDPTIQLQTPTHADNWKTFDGWYTAATGGEKVTTIATGSTGNKTLFAKWKFIGTPGLSYTKSADGQAWEVSKGGTLSGAIGIPSKHGDDGLPVRIKEDGFTDVTDITSVILDDGVTSIGNKAFYRCSNLANIVIPNSVTSIGFSAFYRCSNLANIVIPDSVTSIGQEAFYNCDALTSVKLPKDITSIASYTFRSCDGLTSVTIPNSVISIEMGAFNDCSQLTSVTIPDSVKSIGDNAFRGCTSLTSVNIQSGVTSMGAGAFNFCTALKSIFIPSSVTTMAGNVFDNCTVLTISCQASGKPTDWDTRWMGSDNPVPAGRISWGQTRP